MKHIHLTTLVVCCLVVGPDFLEASPAQQPNRVAGLERAHGPLVLVRDGKPAATIVISKNVTNTVRYAVQELNEHLKLSTGTELAVVEDGQATMGSTIHV